MLSWTRKSDSCPLVVFTRASVNCLLSEPRGGREACLYISITPKVFYVPISRNTNNILSKLLQNTADRKYHGKGELPDSKPS